MAFEALALPFFAVAVNVTTFVSVSCGVTVPSETAITLAGSAFHSISTSTEELLLPFETETISLVLN